MNEHANVQLLTAAVSGDVVCLASLPGEGLVVDAENGVIRNVSVITGGLARPRVGEPFMVDTIMLSQIADGINANPDGVDVRITHPELSDQFVDPIEVLVGCCKNARVVGDRVRGDIYLGPYAEFTPMGNMLKYLPAVAASRPQSIAMSAVYARAASESGLGGMQIGRVARVIAVDFVGQGAANPNGLLSGAKQNNQNNSGGTDADGKTQSSETTEGENTMPPELRKFLEGKGLAATASCQEATEFMNKLNDQDKAAAQKLAGEQDQETTKDNQSSGDQQTGGLSGAQPAATQHLSGGAAGDVAVAERQKFKEIVALGAKFNMPADWANEQFLSGRSIDQIRNSILEDMAVRNAPTKIGAGSHIGGMTDTNISTLAAGVGDAILLRAGVPLLEIDALSGRAVRDAGGRVVARKAHDRAGRFARLSLMSMGKQWLSAVGVDETEYLSNEQVWQLVMNPKRLSDRIGIQALAMGTSDFPYLLEDTVRKALRAYYEESQATWPQWCDRDTAADFKNKRLVSLSAAPDMVARLEGEGINYVTLGESREVCALLEWASGIRFTKRMMMEDDMSAFNRSPRLLSDTAHRKEEDLPYAILNGNPVMGDGKTLFHADHNNIATGSDIGVVSIATLTAALTAMALQTGEKLANGNDGPCLDLVMEKLLVPTQQQVAAETLIASSVDPSKTNNTPNPHSGRYGVIGSSRLAKASASAWYGATDPRRFPTITMLFLEGQQTPQISSDTDFDTDDLKIKCVHYCAAKAVDYRGLYKNPGTT